AHIIGALPRTSSAHNSSAWAGAASAPPPGHISRAYNERPLEPSKLYGLACEHGQARIGRRSIFALYTVACPLIRTRMFSKPTVGRYNDRQLVFAPPTCWRACFRSSGSRL